MSVDPSKYSTIVNVRNIGEDMTNEELKGMFSKYGTVTSCKIMLSPNAECGRFAYVAFQDPDAAEEAIIELHCQELIQGRRIYVRRTGEKIIRQPKVKKSTEIPRVQTVNRREIFVSNLDGVVDARDLDMRFRHCGTITSAKIISDQVGRSKGYGFVSFATHEAANKAVTEMKEHVVYGKRIRVALATGTDRNENLRRFVCPQLGIRRLHRDVPTNFTASTLQRTRTPLFSGYGKSLETIMKSLHDGDRS